MKRKEAKRLLDLIFGTDEQLAAEIMNTKNLGRPPLPLNKRASSQIQLRVSRSRKAAYVRAAKPGTLAGWIFGILDKAANYIEK